MSWVWQFFEKIDNTMARCIICQREYSHHSTSHNLKKHLDRKHPTLAPTEGESPQMWSDDEEVEPSEKKPKLCPNTHENITDEHCGSDDEEKLRVSVETEGQVKNEKGRHTKWIWDYFTRIDKVRAECRLCMGTYTYESTIGNLRKHLAGRHRNVVSPQGKHKSSWPTSKPDTETDVDAEDNENGRRTSWIWEYFTRTDSCHAMCGLCGGKYSFESSTTNLKRHLERMHPEIVSDMPERPYSKVSSSRTSGSAEANSKEQFTEVFIASPDSPETPTPASLSRRQTDDALEQFGRYVAVLLRRLPEEVANTMQADFVTKIMQAQIEHDKACANKTTREQNKINGDSVNAQCPLTDVILEVTNS